MDQREWGKERDRRVGLHNYLYVNFNVNITSFRSLCKTTLLLCLANSVKLAHYQSVHTASVTATLADVSLSLLCWTNMEVYQNQLNSPKIVCKLPQNEVFILLKVRDLALIEGS